MRSFYLLVVLLLIFSCKNSKNATEEPDSSIIPVHYLESCPDNGICSIQVMHQTNLLVKTDETGKFYPVTEKGESLVIKYVYKRNSDENIADSNYSEIIYFELPDTKLNLNLQDKDLSQVKLLYGRLCFCRDASGYFPVTKGKLITEKTGKNQLKIVLNFSMKKIPQIIKQIDETVDLN